MAAVVNWRNSVSATTAARRSSSCPPKGVRLQPLSLPPSLPHYDMGRSHTRTLAAAALWMFGASGSRKRLHFRDRRRFIEVGRDDYKIGAGGNFAPSSNGPTHPSSRLDLLNPPSRLPWLHQKKRGNVLRRFVLPRRVPNCLARGRRW